MKINFKIGFYLFAFLTTLFLGCTKEVILIEPDPNGHARVLNTDVPVPFARIAYLKANNDGFISLPSYTILKMDTADANGDFRYEAFKLNEEGCALPKHAEDLRIFSSKKDEQQQ